MSHTLDSFLYKPLSNSTNVLLESRTRLPDSASPQDVRGKRAISQVDQIPKKRPRTMHARATIHSDATGDMEAIEIIEEMGAANRPHRHHTFGLLKTTFDRPLTMPSSAILPSRCILQSFVSSNKSDVYTTHSLSDGSFASPPYACAYSNGAKHHGTPLLAVATEEGSVMIMNTSRRTNWEFGSQPTLFRPHYNGIFDIQWSSDDSVVATASGDKTTRITSVETQQALHDLRAHSSTVKCIAWNPFHRDLICTGGRDGNIYVWDLRMTNYAGPVDSRNGVSHSLPVMAIDTTHGQEKTRGRRSIKRPPRSVTGLLYTDAHSLVNSGSFDGVLSMWDLRQPKADAAGKRTKKKSAATTPACVSPTDPTMLHGARRARGLMALCAGSAHTTGLLFALGADCRIHTYTSPVLAPAESITHPNLQASFYVRLATSPCGRWLASGCAGKNGSLFLYDVANAGRVSSALRAKRFGEPLTAAVELRGQMGEVGGVDWADGMVAGCADDSTVRVWRPDLSVYQGCISDPEEKRWEWSWARDVYPS